MNPTIGSSIGPYRLTGLIGQGGMGLVYLGEHTLIGKKVAVKTVRPELIEHPGVAERFINEARAVNTIGDEHIVDIFDAGQTPEGVVYCVMELLVGESLHDFATRRGGKVDLDLALEIVVQIARALHVCHEKNIIHRDLKPANVFILQKGGAPFVKILDFGIAKLIGQSSASTHSNAIVGTPFYMAPEQCRGAKDLDRRIDVYALGVILYELATGTLPFDGNSAGDVIIKQATELVEDPRVRNPKLPDWIARVILHSLEKQREDRFPDMAAFAAAIEARGDASYVPVTGRRDSRSATPSPGSGSFSSGPFTPNSLRGAPTESLLVTPLESLKLEQKEETLSPAIRSRGGAAAKTGRSVTQPPSRGVSKVVVAVAALIVVALVIVAGRYVVQSKTAETAEPATSGVPSTETPKVEARPGAPAVRPESETRVVVTPTAPPVTPEPPPVRLGKRPTSGVVTKTPRAPTAAPEPQVTPVTPAAPPRAPAEKPSTNLDSFLPPESMLPPSK